MNKRSTTRRWDFKFPCKVRMILKEQLKYEETGNIWNNMSSCIKKATKEIHGAFNDDGFSS